MNYYNDIDKNAAAWTRQLITDKLIPDGVMDCKSITEIKPDELNGYTQCHFFKGISGWARALDLAHWPSTRPVWCASLPCQPFSCAGKGEGVNDERHLWPVFFNLVKSCRPVVIVGEQVEAAVGHGWLDGVFADLEGEGYACGAVVLGAHSVGAPHRRQRIYWVAKRMADTNRGCNRTSDATGANTGRKAAIACSGSGKVGGVADTGHEQPQEHGDAAEGQQHGRGRQPRSEPASCCGEGGLANTSSVRFNELSQRELGGSQEEGRLQQSEGACSTGCGAGRALGHPNHSGCETCGNVASGTGQGSECAAKSGAQGGLAHADRRRCEQRDATERDIPVADTNRAGVIVGNAHIAGLEGHRRHGNLDGKVGREVAERHSSTAGFWDGAIWHMCRDGKQKRIPADAQSVFQWLADGLPEGMDHIRVASLGFPLSKTIPNRTATLKGYGNAIVPQVAAEFLKIVMDLCANWGEAE